MATVRRGILRISNSMLAYVRGSLPPWHHVVAERSTPESGYVEWIIDGPFMPECEIDAEPIAIHMNFTRYATGQIIGRTNGHEWPVATE